MVCKNSILTLVSFSNGFFSELSLNATSALYKFGTTVTFMFYRFFSSLTRSIICQYFLFLLYSFYGPLEQQNLWNICYSFLFLFKQKIWCSDHYWVIHLYLKTEIILLVSFFERILFCFYFFILFLHVQFVCILKFLSFPQFTVVHYSDQIVPSIINIEFLFKK